MAVQEIMDYLENGNIRNSVNYPPAIWREEDGLPCSGITYEHSEHDRPDHRSAGCRKINISDMTNKSRDKFAYTLMDLEHVPDETMVEKLNAIEGVCRVRLI